jgi:hypothetical protein
MVSQGDDGNEDLRKEIDLREKTEKFLKNQPVIDLRRKLASIDNAVSEKSVAQLNLQVNSFCATLQ